MRANRIFNYPVLWLVGALILASALKIWLVSGGFLQFNSDEAIVGLMARHILQGELPVFFYGQAYMGSLDAFLVAGGFSVFGQYVWVIRLVQGILYLGVLLTTAWLGKLVFLSWKTGISASWLLAIPVVNVFLYTTVSLGGYGEALLIGNLLMIFSLRIGEQVKQKLIRKLLLDFTGFGFLVGVGLWAFGLTLVFVLPASLYVIYHVASVNRIENEREIEKDTNLLAKTSINYPQRLFWMLSSLAGFAIGALPMWGYGLDHGFQSLIAELRGQAIAGIEGLNWLQGISQHLFNLIILGSTVVFGFRPPWDVTWLGLPLLPFMLVFWLLVIFHIYKSVNIGNSRRAEKGVLIGVLITVILGFILTPFGADPSGRYFLPLAVPMALFAADFIIGREQLNGKWAYGIVVFVLFFNLWGIIQSAIKFPPGITTQFYAPAQIDHRYDRELIDFLTGHGETRGYSNYWVSYPLAFLSKESLIFVPRLPYHPDFRYTSRDDRYAPYTDLVDNADRVAYITTNHPALDDFLRKGFRKFGIAWQEELIGDYHVFYELSEVIRPSELGLDATSP